MESHFPEDVEIKSFEEVCKFCVSDEMLKNS